MSKTGKYRESAKEGNYAIEVQVKLYSWEEEGLFYVYAPAMDLTGYGNTQAEADDSFEITLSETLKYMENKLTMYDELERLGWMVNRRMNKVQAPDMDTMLAENDEFAKLSKKPGVKVSDKSLELALV